MVIDAGNRAPDGGRIVRNLLLEQGVASLGIPCDPLAWTAKLQKRTSPDEQYVGALEQRRV